MAFTLHIGFDFWGAGNLGDDLMLAGFLRFIEQHRIDCRVTALCAHDIAAMRRRFPGICWHGADLQSRTQALHEADAWLGLGGGVFQVEVGPWILDQMLVAATAAKTRGIPAHLVGVGVNNAAAITASQSSEIHRLVDRLWLRDSRCLELALAGGFSAEKTILGADTAHIYCADAPRSAEGRREGALVIHAEEEMIARADLDAVIAGSRWSLNWVCQEYRELRDTEARIHGLLPVDVRSRLPLVRPTYHGASVETLRDVVATWNVVLSCRFHTCLAAAWAGARLAVYERNQKLEAVRADLSAQRCLRLDEAGEILRALEEARTVDPSRLWHCHQRAESMLTAYFAELGLLAHRKPVSNVIRPAAL